MSTAQTISRGPFAGLAYLDVLAALAAGDRDIAALHSAADGRWSVIGIGPALTIEFSADGVGRWIAYGNRAVPPIPQQGTLLEVFDAMMASVRLVGGPQPRAQAVTPGKPGAILAGSAPLGWLGWIGYDIGRHLENVGTDGRDDMGWPLLRWSLFESYYLLDHQRGQWYLVALQWESDPPDSAERRLDQMQEVLSKVAPAEPLLVPAAGAITQCMARADYCRRVERVIDYIGAGDAYQVNLAQRWTIETPEPPLATFRRLCQATPAPYAAYFRFGDRAIASASPELFVERRGAELLTRPIKGTRPRDLRNPAADSQLRNELLDSPKDKAELAMIVDLLRNDLGRVCRFGTVHVLDPRQVEAHPTVWHTVATISGQLAQAETGWGSIAAALCPGGSITGAPKIRAMQIIGELEEFRRGLYCGNIGWIGAGGNGCLNIAIRTIQLQQCGPTWRGWIWAGGGVVADSDPQAEYEETMYKAAALWRALGGGGDREA